MNDKFGTLALNCQLSHTLEVQFFSSEPSVQSASPSHFQAVGMHWAVEPPHRNSVTPQVTGLVCVQFFSSDPSLQSSSRSQTHLLLMHRPLLHLNWLLEQVEYSKKYLNSLTYDTNKLINTYDILLHHYYLSNRNQNRNARLQECTFRLTCTGNGWLDKKKLHSFPKNMIIRVTKTFLQNSNLLRRNCQCSHCLRRISTFLECNCCFCIWNTQESKCWQL